MSVVHLSQSSRGIVSSQPAQTVNWAFEVVVKVVGKFLEFKGVPPNVSSLRSGEGKSVIVDVSDAPSIKPLGNYQVMIGNVVINLLGYEGGLPTQQYGLPVGELKPNTPLRWTVEDYIRSFEECAVSTKDAAQDDVISIGARIQTNRNVLIPYLQGTPYAPNLGGRPYATAFQHVFPNLTKKPVYVRKTCIAIGNMVPVTDVNFGQAGFFKLPAPNLSWGYFNSAGRFPWDLPYQNTVEYVSPPSPAPLFVSSGDQLLSLPNVEVQTFGSGFVRFVFTYDPPMIVPPVEQDAGKYVLPYNNPTSGLFIRIEAGTDLTTFPYLYVTFDTSSNLLAPRNLVLP